MDMSRCYSLTFVAVFAWSFSSAAAGGTNWHASQVSLRRLYDLQARQLVAAKTYLASETDRLRHLERAYSSIFKLFASNSSVKNTFILNHLNSVKLMKRIYNAQLEIKLLLNNEQSIKAIKSVYEEEAINELNLLAVYRSLRRLQKVYAIPASDMAAGRHKNRIIGDPLDACECYAMVKYGFDNSDVFGIVDWMVQAYKKWLDSRPTCVDMDELLDYMKFTSIVTGYSFDNLPNFQEIRHSESTKTIDQYMSLVENDLSLRHVNVQPDIYETYDDFEKHTVFKNFRHLCKTGESKPSLTSNFKCRYQTKNDLYRSIMPFKEEDISHDPYLKLYHDMIFEEEIKYIIDLAEKDLSDAAFYTKGKVSLVENKRLGQLKWFSESANPTLFNKLNNRVECLTGFSTETAEGYQTVNYGVGGHFSVHVDAFTDMTDVVDDGYTIFPNLNYVAHCRRGTAMIWRNLYLNNGTVHSGTFHGGCPVLKGNKWIMTKGLYEGGQPLVYDWKTNKKVVIV